MREAYGLIKHHHLRFVSLSGSCLIGLLASSSALAQIVPDNTLPTNSVVSPNCITCEITGGTSVGNNLFHSFEQFSVPIGGSAFFNNTAKITTIFSRVTGRSISNIDGVLRVNDKADLFLLNPNGIIFGPNASLNINGSFLATTGDRIIFFDGSEFSTQTTQSPPLLTINVPIGVGIGESPGGIINRSLLGLQVLTGKTLALVGGELALEGGILSTPGGRIELGSVTGNSIVGLTPIQQGWKLSYPGTQVFGDIRLTDFAFVGSSNFQGADIQVQGRRITLTDGSAISSVKAEGQAGNLAINASESVEIDGVFDGFPSEVSNEVVGDATGSGSELAIETRRLILSNGAKLSTTTRGTGQGADLKIRASESVELIGTSSSVDFSSGLFAQVASGATGAGGLLFVETRQLIVRDGAQISSATFGDGSAGDLKIDASESIILAGSVFSPSLDREVPSGLFSQVEKDAKGDGGTLSIETSELTLLDGAQISSAARSEGLGGTVTINASEFVRISGASPRATATVGRSGIFVSAEETARQSAGNLNIFTPELIVENRGEISANNFGPSQGGTITLDLDQLIVRNGGDIRATSFDENTGRAGNLNIRSQFVSLDGGRLTAETSGQGGANIQLEDVKLLFLDNQGLISAQAFNEADGGNITINAVDGFIVAIPTKDSDIVADADRGNGGNINIATQGIFGLEYRQQRTPESDITANSISGRAGTVNITRLSVDPSQGLSALPTTPVDPSTQIAQGCSTGGRLANQENQFIVTGRGGLPSTPNDLFTPDLVQDDLGTIVKNNSPASQPLSVSPTHPPKQLVEAQGWIIDTNGKITLVAQAPTVTLHNPSLTPPPCQGSKK